MTRWILLALAMTGCVHQSDLVAWQGAPVRELQTHSFFSTLPKRVETLGDGQELWIYSNCGTSCATIGNSVSCGDVCCSNQFFVRHGVVEQYRPVGRCRTDCSVRPGGTCQAPAVATAAGPSSVRQPTAILAPATRQPPAPPVRFAR